MSSLQQKIAGDLWILNNSFLGFASMQEVYEGTKALAEFSLNSTTNTTEIEIAELCKYPTSTAAIISCCCGAAYYSEHHNPILRYYCYSCDGAFHRYEFNTRYYFDYIITWYQYWTKQIIDKEIRIEWLEMLLVEKIYDYAQRTTNKTANTKNTSI